MIERDEIEQVIAALELTTAMCRAATTWTPDDIQGLRYHALEAAKAGMEALKLSGLLQRRSGETESCSCETIRRHEHPPFGGVRRDAKCPIHGDAVLRNPKVGLL